MTEAELPEGVQVAILVADESEFDLDPEDQEQIASAVSSLSAGEGTSINALQRKLAQLR